MSYQWRVKLLVHSNWQELENMANDFIEMLETSENADYKTSQIDGDRILITYKEYS